jgi:nitrogen fixation/metabolism regulation signal transduction histidine kinase
LDNWLEHFARTNFRRSGDTAHDLKTPLNVAVLNLELLRMRMAKLAAGADDEKISTYLSAIETELRRLARIFDTFFILSTPPKNEDAPVMLNLTAMAVEASSGSGFSLKAGDAANVRAHDSRMRQAFKLFFEGAAKVLEPGGRAASTSTEEDRFELVLSGKPAAADFEPSKIFKFYYTDALGNPDLSLAAARLIVETYGGELNATEDRDKFMLRLSVPLGDQ